MNSGRVQTIDDLDSTGKSQATQEIAQATQEATWADKGTTRATLERAWATQELARPAGEIAWATREIARALW